MVRLLEQASQRPVASFAHAVTPLRVLADAGSGDIDCIGDSTHPTAPAIAVDAARPNQVQDGGPNALTADSSLDRDSSLP